jgi:hypothetical protein
MRHIVARACRLVGFMLIFLLVFFLISAFAATSLFAQADVSGQWNTLPNSMPINPVHVAMLHNGKILVVSGSGNYPSNTNYQAGIFDPATGLVSTQPVTWDMFCNGMVILPDGRPIVAGGTQQYDPFHGSARVSLYNPATNVFSNTGPMAVGRWYPTATELGDGRIMLFSGLDINGSTTPAVEFYTAATGWSAPVNAPWIPPLYPRMTLLPNGTVFYSGPGSSSALFDPTAQAWTQNVARTNYGGYRGYGTTVLLPLTAANNYTPSVMIMGGGNPSTATTEIIDMSQLVPAWSFGPPMSQPRIEMNAVILPSGKVLALGGSLNDEDNNTASLNADLYDPVSNSFASAGANAFPRLYHSVALLMPDATVWVAGGNPTRFYQTQMEIYQPAYLFTRDSGGHTVLATRPTIGNAPTAMTHGSSFVVSTPDANSISSIALIRAGADTHAFDMDQRMIGLSFTNLGNGKLKVNAPSDGNLAPPGYYMLFVVNSSGVPSVAKWMQVRTKGTYTVTVTPPTQTVARGSTSTFTVSVTPLNGFQSNVTLGTQISGSYITGSLNPVTVGPNGTSTLTVIVGAKTAPGTRTVRVIGSSGQLGASGTLTLTVQ